MKALLVIDMLEDFINKDGKLYTGDGVEEILPFIKTKIKEYRDSNDMIIYICDNHQEDDAEFDMFTPHCVAGTKGAQIVKEIAPEDSDKIVYKRRYSGFFGTDLDITLREKEITDIGIVGVCTNICVLYSTADARNLGYNVKVYRDGVATFSADAHEFALQEIEHTLGAVVE